MRVVVHLSDLHFGSARPRTLEPLRRRIHELRPHVVVVSGDLTQRARSAQFRAAREFLDTLPRPQVVVPGNHDVPLYNVFQRFLAPLDKYRRYISEDLEPSFVDAEIAVVGVNTARSLVFKGGRINEEQVGRVRARLCALDDAVTKIVVTHHPFDMPDDWGDPGQVVGRADMAMKTLAHCGADVLVAGHMHRSHAGETVETLEAGGASALLVGAGTATSTRDRGEANAFNAITVESGRIAVERFAWDEAASGFVATRRQAFERGARGWTAAG